MIRRLPVVKGAVLEIHSGTLEGGLPLCPAIPLWVPRKAVRIAGTRISVRCPLSTLSRANSRGVGEPLPGLARTIRILDDLENDRAKAAVLLCASLMGEDRDENTLTAMSTLSQYAGFASAMALWPARTRYALPIVSPVEDVSGSSLACAEQVLKVLEEYAPLIVQPIEAHKSSAPSLSYFQKVFPEGTDVAEWAPRGALAWQKMSRTRLAALVWEKPMSHLALEFGVSNTAIRKACIRRGIDLPSPNYWRGKSRSEARVAVKEPTFV